jgi:hypothetical protein
MTIKLIFHSRLSYLLVERSSTCSFPRSQKSSKPYCCGPSQRYSSFPFPMVALLVKRDINSTGQRMDPKPCQQSRVPLITPPFPTEQLQARMSFLMPGSGSNRRLRHNCTNALCHVWLSIVLDCWKKRSSVNLLALVRYCSKEHQTFNLAASGAKASWIPMARISFNYIKSRLQKVS